MWDSTTIRITAMRLLYQGTTLVVPKKDTARSAFHGSVAPACPARTRRATEPQPRL
jgi:hypothetical protein